MEILTAFGAASFAATASINSHPFAKAMNVAAAVLSALSSVSFAIERIVSLHSQF